MIFSSISPRRANRDPEPWVYPDGTRHAGLSDPTAEHPLPEPSAVTYSPRAEYLHAGHNPVNPILDAMRDTWDDPWGSAMAWGFAVVSALDVLEAPVPEEMGYRPSVAGSEADLTDGSYECAEVVSLLGMGLVLSPEDAAERLAALRAEFTAATDGDDPTDFAMSEDDWQVGLSAEDAHIAAVLTEAEGSTEYVTVLTLDTMPVADQHRAIHYLTHAAAVLHRYLDAARAAGLDY